MIRRAILIAAFTASSCAHELTVAENREEANRHEQEAAREKSKYDPAATERAVAPRTPFVEQGLPDPQFYNPTEEHLAAADRQMKAAFDHLEAAHKLEKFEAEACAGLTVAQRTACPLLNPWVMKVEETGQGVRLWLRPTAPDSLSTQMRCHLAWAKANGFEKTPCPLYVRGVSIDPVADHQIDVHSLNASVAGEVRAEARRMFGQP